MALLDFSDILVDPDLASTVSVIRRPEVVGSNGRATFTETQTDGVTGVVTAGDPGKLARREEGQMTDNAITVTTSYRLRASGLNIQADVILYGGIRYTVKALKRWPQLGSGFVKALAASENAYDAAM